MRQINLPIYMLLLAFTAASCIKAYEPEIEKGDQSLYVVSGQVTNEEGYQYVNVSISSGVNAPTFIPVTGCLGEIQDEAGNSFPLEELGEGAYRTWMAASDLAQDRSYRVSIILPGGKSILSEYDLMRPCPEIDSVYFEVSQVLTNDPENPVLGIQFYTDLDASGYDARFFRWEVEETWEYHMDFAREWYFDGSTHKIDPPDKSTQVCWKTVEVSEIFTVSTRSLGQNMYKRQPLHFVNNRTTRLTSLYSALIRQYALSEEAYEFWDKMRVNSQAQGGLYEKQPLPVDGNLYMPSDPGQRVLGFFSAASVTSRRVFVSDVEELELEPAPLCIGPVPLGIFGWSDFDPDEYPLYFTRIDGSINTLEEACLDCRIHGGTTEKPEYWPE